MVKGVRSGVNGQPLLSARSTWSTWWTKARAATARSVHSPRVSRPGTGAAGRLRTADLFIVYLLRTNLVNVKIAGRLNLVNDKMPR
jgi:hypothetical protein